METTYSLVHEQVYLIPISAEEAEIQFLKQDKEYSKSELARFWGVGRRTVLRWHDIALEYAPKYCEGFAHIRNIAQCPSCRADFEVTELQRRYSRRRSLISCPHCKEFSLPDIQTIEETKKSLKIPGRYARVLRIVGHMVAIFGTAATTNILTTHPDYKKLRANIRRILGQ